MSKPDATSQSTSSQHKLWLLIYNCQAFGLANSLELLCPEIKVETYTHESYREHEKTVIAKLDKYHHIIISPDLEKNLGCHFEGRDNVWRIPPLIFYGYHADLCYLLKGEKILNGPMGGYNSTIAYAAFQCGLTEKQTLALYREDIYASLGYFDYWGHERNRIISAYNNCGLDMSQYFIEWSRKGPFMYMSNHPKIFCLRDLAKAILGRTNLEVIDADFLPMDNLANGPIFPVYPEIGSRLGVRGNFLFKRARKYECIQLEEYISESFQIYRNSPGMKPHLLHEGKIAQAISVVDSRK